MAIIPFARSTMKKSDLRLRILIHAFALATLILIFGVVFLNKPIAFIKGLVLGFSVSVLMFFQLSKAVEKALTLLPSAAQGHMMGQYFVRMSVYALTIVAAAKTKNVDVPAVFIGFLCIRGAIFFMTIFNRLEGK